MFCSINVLELQWQLNHLLIKFATTPKVVLQDAPTFFTANHAKQVTRVVKVLPPHLSSALLPGKQCGSIAIGALCLPIVLFRMVALSAWEANVGVLPLAQNVYPTSYSRSKEMTEGCFCFLGTKYRLKSYLSNNCHKPPFGQFEHNTAPHEQINNGITIMLLFFQRLHSYVNKNQHE